MGNDTIIDIIIQIIYLMVGQIIEFSKYLDLDIDMIKFFNSEIVTNTITTVTMTSLALLLFQMIRMKENILKFIWSSILFIISIPLSKILFLQILNSFSMIINNMNLYEKIETLSFMPSTDISSIIIALGYGLFSLWSRIYLIFIAFNLLITIVFLPLCLIVYIVYNKPFKKVFSMQSYMIKKEVLVVGILFVFSNILKQFPKQSTEVEMVMLLMLFLLITLINKSISFISKLETEIDAYENTNKHQELGDDIESIEAYKAQTYNPKTTDTKSFKDIFKNKKGKCSDNSHLYTIH